jgi:hypothetical protein
LAHAYDRLATGQAKERSLMRELVEVTLSKDLAREVLELIVDAKTPVADHVDHLREILANPVKWPYTWVRICAIHAMARCGRRDLMSLVNGQPVDGPTCRTVVWAVGELCGEGLQERTR